MTTNAPPRQDAPTPIWITPRTRAVLVLLGVAALAVVALVYILPVFVEQLGNLVNALPGLTDRLGAAVAVLVYQLLSAVVVLLGAEVNTVLVDAREDAHAR